MHYLQIFRRRSCFCNFVKQRKYFIYKTINAVQTFIGPHRNLVKRADKHFIHSESVRTVSINYFVRIDYIPARFWHFLAVFRQNHSVGSPLVIRFLGRNITAVIQEFMPETRIKQVQCRMFHASVIPINVHPIVESLFWRKFLVIMRVAVSQEIPWRTGPVRHNIRFASGMSAAFRAGRINPVCCLGQRRIAVVVWQKIRNFR